MTFAVHAFNYCNDDLVLRWVANVYPHVETIYLVYPEAPWDYNPAVSSDESYRNTADPTLVQKSRYADKIRFVLGQWPSDEAQRNHVVDLARREGHDYLIVQDIDEFYRPEEMQKNLSGIIANPDFCLYKNPWNIFWKNVSYVLEFRETVLNHNAQCRFIARNTPTSFSTSFALNLRRKARFFRSRAVACDEDDIFLLPGLCCHLSWVKSDADVRLKLDTWTHSAEVWPRWFHVKWLNWRPSSRWLSYSDPLSWNRAVPFEGLLPMEIADYQPGFQAAPSRSMKINVDECLFDAKARLYSQARQFKRALRTTFSTRRRQFLSRRDG